MQIFKQDSIIPQYGTFSHDNVMILSLSASVMFHLDKKRELVKEQDALPLLQEIFQNGSWYDIGMPKPHGELLLSATAFAPEEKPVQGLEIQISVGNIISKKLVVSGERHWSSLLEIPSDPLPFTTMPITWENTFGGNGYAANPSGKGFITDNKDLSLVKLPNIEYLDKRIRSPHDKLQPAGLGPLPPDNPVRLAKTGTYNAKWLSKKWPYFPDDFDWSYWNCAPEDQQIDGFFKGDEPVALYHLHPQNAVIETSLPGLRLRCFAKKADEPANIFHETVTRIDTVWFFPAIGKGMVIFRALIPVNNDEASDITHLFFELESLSEEPKPPELYLPDFQQTIMETTPIDIAMFREQKKLEIDALKSAIQKEVDQIPLQLEEGRALASKMVDEKKAELLKQLGPELYASAAIDETLKVPDNVQGKVSERAQVAQMVDLALKAPDAQKYAVNKYIDACEKAGVDPVAKYIENLKTPPPDPVDTLKKTKTTLLDVDTRGNDKALQNINDAVARIDESIPRITEEIAKADAQWAKAEVEFAKMYSSDKGTWSDLAALTKIPELAKLDQQKPLPDTLDVIKQEVNRRTLEQPSDMSVSKVAATQQEQLSVSMTEKSDTFMPNQELFGDSAAQYVAPDPGPGGSFTAEDYAGFDFSGKDFSGADFTNCNLDGANLSNTCIDGAIFSGAILTNVDLSGASAKGTVFKEAVMTKVNAAGTNFNDACFVDADLSESTLDGADFSNADLSNAIMVSSSALKAIFTGALCTKTQFSSSNLSETDFSEAKLVKANLEEANLDKALFVKAELSESEIDQAIVTNVDFSGAQMVNCRAYSGTVIKNCNFSTACLKEAVLKDVVVENSNFSDSVLDRANFAGAKLSDANLSGVLARSTVFMKADLTGATLEKANLFGSNMRKAVLVRTNLSNTNCYGVEFYQSIHGETLFSGANLKGTKLEDLAV